MLKFFELEARFPHNASEVPAPAVDYVAEQVKVHPGEFAHHDWNGRAIERLEPPGRIERIIGAATAAFEQRFCDRTVPRLGEHCAERLEDFAERQLLAELKADPGQVGLETLLREIDKLNAIRSLRLPPDLFAGASEKLVEAWRARAARSYPSDLCTAPRPVRLTLLAALCRVRSAEIADALVDLLIGLVHKINARADRRVDGS